jgi:hypothetical protein
LVRIATMLAAGALLAGCGGGASSSIAGQSPGPASPSAEAYVAALNAAQSKLAAAERAIPRRPKTPKALARAISLLQSAIRGLSDNLSSIHPPASVAALHAQLVAIVRTYAARLGHAARVASQPLDELAAANLLSSATNQATRDFTATVAKINQALGATQ